LLALITLLAYWPVARDGFINFDDQVYVTENRVVQNGLTWGGIQRAFTSVHASNWHPLTWLSHMMDCEAFGLNAGAHHIINVLFHMANGVLLLWLLFRLINALWPAAFVAALFAWHPLHVESVAWISERKDVLSTFFALLTLLAYVKAVTRDKGQVTGTSSSLSPVTCHRSPSYWLALFFFALGLMSKPMLVTLPFVMLLLDYWPLRRVPGDPWPGRAVLRLALEKWPFFLLALISCVVTYQAQRHSESVVTLQQFPLPLRIENALISYERYLGKTFWPSDLAILYPLPTHLLWMQVMAATAAGLLAVISWLVWRTRRECPFLLAGWLWFLGTLVPVIGLVQVGSAAMADRYTYFPLVGVFIAVAFGVRRLADRFQFPKAAVAVAAVLTLAACLVLTGNQLRYWRDSETLFAHALAVTDENPHAQLNYGTALERKGRLPEALAQYREVVRLIPDQAEVRYNIGNVLDKMGRPEDALPELLKAVQLNPKLPSSHNTLGAVLVELSRFHEAMNEFTNAVRLDPDDPWPHFELAKVLLKQGRDGEAIDEFRAALRLDPDNFQILAYTAHVLAAHENPQIRNGKTALVLAAKATAQTGGAQPFVLDALGMACAETGDFTNAQAVTQRAIDLATTAQMKELDPLQQRLEHYKNHQPWRESFLSTNPPTKELPKK
jgi:tetratricopeptide (TPR) repeat protein